MSTVLLIGGSDSSGGAGLARDLRTLTDLDVRALCAITAVTAQTDRAFVRSDAMPAGLVAAQIEAALATAIPAAVKTGMLVNAATVAAVARALGAHREIPLVLDPVLLSSSAGVLLDEGGRRALLEELLPRAALVTPNIPELARLLDADEAADEAESLRQGAALLARCGGALLIKGGHAAGEEAVDWLLTPEQPPQRLSAARLTQGMRGSGCALASAIAAYLAHGAGLAESCLRAKEYLTALMQRGG